MQGVTLEVKGMSDMMRKLNARLRRLEQNVMRKALEAFAEPIRADGERWARSLISPRLKFVIKTKMRGEGGTVYIGPSTEVFATDPKSGRSISHANVAYWFEFGYDIRRIRRGPALVHVGARPSLTPAYLAKKEEGLAAMEQVLRDALEQEV